MPSNFIKFYNILNQINCGDTIPQSLSSLWNQHLSDHRQLNVICDFFNQALQFSTIEEFEEWEINNADQLSDMIVTNLKLTKTQFMQVLQDHSQRQNYDTESVIGGAS
jgi:hypothetical protein